MEQRPIRIGDRLVAPGEGLTALSRERDSALEKNTNIKERFQYDACQCCGHRETNENTCVCDGLDWYMDRFGNVECQAHKFARAIGDGKKTFLMGKSNG